MRRFQVRARDNHQPFAGLGLDLHDFDALLVQQVRRHADRHDGADFTRAVLGGFFQHLAHDGQRQAFDIAYPALAVATRAHGGAGFAQ